MLRTSALRRSSRFLLDIEIEAQRIYREGSEWQEIIPKLLEVRITREEKTRETLRKFHVETSESGDVEDLSLYALRPFWHVRIYKVEDGVDFEGDLNLPHGMNVIHRAEAEDPDALIVVTRQESQPDWIDIPMFEQVEHHVFMLDDDQASRLLFITASKRTPSLYDRIAAGVASSDPALLDLDTVNRALRDLKDTVMYQVGMRVLGLSRSSSYVTKTGPRPADEIARGDGRRFGQGHCMATAVDEGQKVTIGLSSGSKVWVTDIPRYPSSSTGWTAWPRNLLPTRRSIRDPDGTACRVHGLSQLFQTALSPLPGRTSSIEAM